MAQDDALRPLDGAAIDEEDLIDHVQERIAKRAAIVTGCVSPA
jgi:hypothetical protein